MESYAQALASRLSALAASKSGKLGTVPDWTWTNHHAHSTEKLRGKNSAGEQCGAGAQIAGSRSPHGNQGSEETQMGLPPRTSVSHRRGRPGQASADDKLPSPRESLRSALLCSRKDPNDKTLLLQEPNSLNRKAPVAARPSFSGCEPSACLAEEQRDLKTSWHA